VLGLFAYMLLGPNASNSLSQDLEFVQKKHASLSLQLDLDKNKSNLALSALYRSRVDYRDKEEETLSKIKDLQGEVDGFTPRLATIEKEIKEKSDELSKLNQEISTAREPIDKIVMQIQPIEEKKKIIEKEKLKLQETLSLVAKEAEQIENKFNSLEVKRNLASDSFEEERSRLMKGIKKPHHLYYAADKEIVVANRAPSGKGIFINNGYIDGFRDNMEFITRNENATSNLSFRLKATLVQKNFSFLKFMDQLQVKDSSFALEGQTLIVTRSGQITEERNQVDQNITLE
jgi:predicted  nucleic acid-binding Zn-ribbon protein